MKSRSSNAWLQRLRDRRHAREQKEAERLAFERREALRRRKLREEFDALPPEERERARRRRRRFGAYGLIAMAAVIGGRHL